ncbi:PadR family transcriptional regulator [Paenibacillus sp. J22TS3]|uniref:PadR family transcriptional regulator n=1 Tax=Paenibacillus sp. J22TS3 TaxID=2807192 RepID=UPI001B183541|nr:PadR family transcriptional regulator [Paenibacillus sp. J22TS3]GIP21862.1 PadR family transcriptional regulator [Paenibacillus sp. J22TS3]
MKVRHAILGVLMDESRSGYEIKQYFENRLSYFYDPSYGTIYPTLKILEQDGLLTKTVVTQDGKPNKNIYSITESGRAEFLECLVGPYEPDTVRSDTLMRLFFGKYVDKSTIIGWLSEAREAARKNITELEQLKEQFGSRMPLPQQFSLEYGIRSNYNKLELTEVFIAKLQEQEPTAHEHDPD